MTGQLSSFVEGTIGEFHYIYPRIDADILYLWAERQQSHYHDPWIHGYWWPYYRYSRYPYYGPYRSGVRVRISGGFSTGR